MTVAEPRALFIDHAGVLGGAELSLLDVATAFGGRAEVILLADGPFRIALEARGVAVSVVPLGALQQVKKSTRLPSPAALADTVRVARRVAKHASTHTVLCANSQKAFVVAVAAGLIAGRPVVWHLRDILAPPHFSRTNITAAVTLANLRAARIIANSRATADAFIAAGGRESLVRVVHNGIDPAPFDAIDDLAVEATRRQLGVPPRAYLVAMFGRFHEWKGQQVLLDALAKVPDVQALIVGAPLFGEEAFGAALTAQATRLGLDGRVHFLGFRADVPLLMRAADVIVHASVYPEPFGRVIVEGMLAGRPVIAARAGGVIEILTDGDTGVLVTPGDSSALAQAIEALRADPAGTAAMAERGRVHARHRFSLQAMVRGVSDALAGLD